MYKRASLLLILLVTVALSASGCFEGFFGPVSSEADAVNTVVNAFMDSLRDADDTAMSGLLAQTVMSENWADWIGVEDGIYGADEFVSAWTDLQLPLEFVSWGDEPEDIDLMITVSGLQFVEGPRTTVNGNHAVSTGRIALDLDHPAEWFDDLSELFEGDAATGTGLTNTVSDIYTVRLELDKIGSDWKITDFMLHAGERQTIMLEAWDTFASALTGIDGWIDGHDVIESQIDEALSVCTDPFFWDGYGDGMNLFGGVTTHFQWREELMWFFTPDEYGEYLRFLALDLRNPVPMELNGYGGAIRAEARVYVGGYDMYEVGYPDLYRAWDDSGIAELRFIVRGGEWLLSGIAYQSLSWTF